VQWQFARFAGWERKEVRRAAFRGLAIGTSTQLFICQKFVKTHRRQASDCACSASFFTCNFLTPLAGRTEAFGKGWYAGSAGYYDNYLVDNHSGVIVGVQATAARRTRTEPVSLPTEEEESGHPTSKLTTHIQKRNRSSTR
jgi:hypothetical protein